MQFKIKQNKIPLKATITAIQGDFTVEDIQEGQSFLINWDSFFEQYYSNPNLLFHLLDADLPNKDQISLNQSPFLEKWQKFAQLQEFFDKIIQQFYQINGFFELTSEQKQIQTKITTLQQEIQSIEFMKKNSIVASKKDLLKKLLIDQESLKKKLEFQQDEFRVNENRMQQYTQHLNELTTELDSLKLEQRALYKETNAITTELDKIEEQTSVYEEKLAEYHSKNQREDEARVVEKLKPLTEKANTLKKDRNTKMQMSKAIQQRILVLQNDIKHITTNQAEMQPEYDRVHKNFTDLKNSLDITSRKILEVQIEIEKELQNASQTDLSILKINVVHQTSKTKDQILRELQDQNNNLSLISDKLMHIRTQLAINENPINKQLDSLNQQIHHGQKLLHEFSDTNLFQTQITKMIADLQIFYKNLNQFLKSISVSVSFTLDVDLNNHRLLIHQSVKYKDKDINTTNDLKRTEKAYYVLSSILSFFMVIKQPLIPILFQKLPSYVTTKQTFLSACKILKDSLETEFVQDHPTVVVLVPNERIEFEPSFFIESEP